jgi:hypothetical protein
MAQRVPFTGGEKESLRVSLATQATSTSCANSSTAWQAITVPRDPGSRFEEYAI